MEEALIMSKIKREYVYETSNGEVFSGKTAEIDAHIRQSEINKGTGKNFRTIYETSDGKTFSDELALTNATRQQRKLNEMKYKKFITSHAYRTSNNILFTGKNAKKHAEEYQNMIDTI